MHYSGKPAMAESRLISIDYGHSLIPYWYDDYKTNKRITITEHVLNLSQK